MNLDVLHQTTKLPPKNSSGGPTTGGEAALKSKSKSAATMEAKPGAAAALGGDDSRAKPISPALQTGPLAPPPPPPAAPAAAMASPSSPRRRRSRPRTHAVQTTALLIFIAGSATYLAINQSARSGLASKLSRFPTNRLPKIQETLLHSIHNVPSLSRKLLAGTRAAATGRTFTVESAELAWESEDAFRQLRHYSPEDNRGRTANPMGRMWEGLEEIFRGLRGGSNEEGRSAGRQKTRRTTADGEGEHQAEDFLSNLSAFAPLSTTLLAICALVFLLAKFIYPTPTYAERSRLILDDTEAEIVEFYEKEMECDEIPFLHDLEEGHDVHPFRRAGSDGSLNWPGPRRNSSDPLLGRHPSLGEMRESQCDLYYSRVLHDIETLNYEEEGEGEIEIEIDPTKVVEVPEGEELDEGECCQITLLENISSLTEEEEESVGGPETAPAAVGKAGSGDETDTECFQSAQSEGGGDEPQDEPQRPQSPESNCSSISSLTSEGYDIEAPLEGQGSHDSFEMAQEGKAQSPLYAWDSPPRRSQSLPDCPESQAFHGGATPQRSNVRKEAKDTKLQRRVSFNPDVGVREIPRETHHSSGLSPEGCLYVMLFAVAVAIVAFSLFPAHPSLSPIYSATRDEILRRTENILNSQWDVEL